MVERASQLQPQIQPETEDYGRSLSVLDKITVPQLKECIVTILSVMNKILVSSSTSKQLFCFSLDGENFTTITLTDQLRDAMWSSDNNIVCTTYYSHQVLVISETGQLIKSSQMTNPKCLSVSKGNVIYLADWKNGVYKSADGGMTWDHVFSSPDGGNCWQVIKVANQNGDDYWTLEMKKDQPKLRVYNIVTNNETTFISYRDVVLPTSLNVNINLLNASMACDGENLIYLSDSFNGTVHIFSVSGKYQRPLSLADNLGSSGALAVEKNQRLFLGTKGSVKIFTLQ